MILHQLAHHLHSVSKTAQYSGSLFPSSLLLFDDIYAIPINLIPYHTVTLRAATSGLSVDESSLTGEQEPREKSGKALPGDFHHSLSLSLYLSLSLFLSVLYCSYTSAELSSLFISNLQLCYKIASTHMHISSTPTPHVQRLPHV